MSFLYYILSLENPCQSKLNNKKEPSILIELLFAMKIDDKINSVLIKNLLYGGKNECKINFILEKWTLYIAMKIELEMNLEMKKWTLYIRWENRIQSEFAFDKMNLVMDNKKELDAISSPMGYNCFKSSSLSVMFNNLLNS